jgi:hypothetical protein
MHVEVRHDRVLVVGAGAAEAWTVSVSARNKGSGCCSSLWAASQCTPEDSPCRVPTRGVGNTLLQPKDSCELDPVMFLKCCAFSFWRLRRACCRTLCLSVKQHTLVVVNCASSVLFTGIYTFTSA